MDIFIEKLVKKQRTSKDTLKALGLILASLVIVFFIIPLIPFVKGFLIFFIVAIPFFAYYVIKSQNIEYEYAYTNGELDVDRIVAESRRKRLLSVDCKDFEIVAKVSSDKYSDEYRKIPNKVEAVSSMASPDVYFAVFENGGKRTILYFEPNDKMIEAMWKYIPRKFFK
ncbi:MULTISPECIES: DUF6106 family protein [Thermoanaerobacterium]|uniref:Uncharacterized protein n=2 Tax=Thermoanaerobacterium TaxID=28895 RepID=W9EEU8_9THEO|nr:MULTISPECIES: DUF6106 family protein [Thermoanaerobacterium]AFK85274.1 hypothetical protein Tsac_0238 [Thermoanaerobacterium saccharolyticum JW/SL-YS485]ETO39771.1 hypothetical protein V518_0055 [Thermoanaerobacterium aotearoense SCUT27]